MSTNKKYNKLKEKSQNIHDSLLHEINKTNSKNKKIISKQINELSNEIKDKYLLMIKEMDKKIKSKKEEINNLKKKMSELNKLTNAVNQEKFLNEIKEIKIKQ
ncbi:hypothetical protein EHP00_2623 [Ecytonucleospora hepatopenaei]|uniref:Uncharacterized protein n=1 Tax=Ecytonucleospora hepatopenaei TaxID=646526 RepID=A0A1W0E2F9_9MICR|nr:hypothetical protein EHP00_2623 [Ecytonucleospora hepatopenaei]